jgi:hypothetical protein
VEERSVLDHNIVLSEEYRIFDKLAKMMDHGMRGPIGWVQMFLQTKSGLIYDEGWNLVVAQGREYVAQRVFNSYAYSGGSRPNWTSHVISHFAVGSGGSIVSGAPSTVTLNGPYICDTGLLAPTSLGIGGYLTEPGGTSLAVKPISASSGSAYLESVSYSGGSTLCSNYTKMKCTCIIPNGEPSSLAPGGTTKIDEAGLYFVVPAATTPLLFSHICFAPKWKEKESTFTLQWYILF